MRPPKTDCVIEISIKYVDKEKQNNENYIHVINEPIPKTDKSYELANSKMDAGFRFFRSKKLNGFS